MNDRPLDPIARDPIKPPPPGTEVGSVLVADPENGDQQFEFEPGSPPDITQEEVA